MLTNAFNFDTIFIGMNTVVCPCSKMESKLGICLLAEEEMIAERKRSDHPRLHQQHQAVVHYCSLNGQLEQLKTKNCGDVSRSITSLPQWPSRYWTKIVYGLNFFGGFVFLVCFKIIDWMTEFNCSFKFLVNKVLPLYLYSEYVLFPYSFQRRGFSRLICNLTEIRRIIVTKENYNWTFFINSFQNCELIWILFQMMKL